MIEKDVMLSSIGTSFLMNYPEASFEISKNATHPFVPSLVREGKPEGRGEFKHG
jgi:hypothetical protein